MSAKYPLDLPPEEPSHRSGNSWTSQLAVLAAEYLVAFQQWRNRRQDLSRAFFGLVLMTLGVLLGSGAAITDNYLHRGVETGLDQPYVVQATGRGMATNIDLRSLDAADVETVARSLGQADFEYARQEFSWSDFEPSRGSYSWDDYDVIVNALAEQNITLIVVIVDTPDWARSIGDSAFDNAPPRTDEMLQSATNALTEHFGARVPFVQVWDRPNLADNWGGKAATAQDFVPYLEAAASGARRGNDEVKIITPELVATPTEDGAETDVQFIEGLYQQGAAATFDIVGISLDGGVNSPDDRRIESHKPSFSRAILFREILVRYDDAGTTVWATSFGWARSESVTAEKQAEFVERGMDRSWSEWPWMGLMVQWAFLVPSNSADAPYSIVNADGTSTPLYRVLTSTEKQMRSRQANTGFTPMDAESVSYGGDWENQHLEGRTFRTTLQVDASTTITFRGTGLIAFVRSGPQVGTFRIEVDGKVVPGGAADDPDLWDLSIYNTTDDFPRTLVDELEDTEHVLTITLVGEGELTLGGFEVTRQAPFVWPIVMMAIGALLAFFFGLRSIAFLFATRAGHLRRPGRPALPGSGGLRIPSWRTDAG